MYTDKDFANKEKSFIDININRESLDSAFAAIVDGRYATAGGTTQDEDTTCQDLTRNRNSKTSLQHGSTSTDIRDVQLNPKEIMLKKELRAKEAGRNTATRNF